MKALCRAMRVARSCYYSYLQKKGGQQEAVLNGQVTKCFMENRRRYGSRRIAAELKVSREKVRRIMAAEGLRAIQPKRFKPRTTESGHGLGASPNLLKLAGGGWFTKGEVLVGDITYLPVRGGKYCYFACFQDKFTRRIVGWQVSERMTAQMVADALRGALRMGQVRKGALVHTDRGSQYASVEYRRLLQANGLRQSMSGKGNCYDNAQAESFFSRFKAELLEEGVFESIEDARSEVFGYIEGYYNRTRLHSSLGYKSPAQFEKELEINQRRESFVSAFS